MPTDAQLRAAVAKGLPYGVAKDIGDLTPLTHTALTGAVDDTLADIATADAALEADLKKLAAKINQIIVALESAGIAV